MKRILTPLNLLAAFVLARFTISKFSAWPISVAGFEDMAATLGVDATAFRILSGIIMGVAALSFILNISLLLSDKIHSPGEQRLWKSSLLFTTGAMAGALFSEFFLRSHVVWPLVGIASLVLFLVLANFLYFRSTTLRRRALLDSPRSMTPQPST